MFGAVETRTRATRPDEHRQRCRHARVQHGMLHTDRGADTHADTETRGEIGSEAGWRERERERERERD